MPPWSKHNFLGYLSEWKLLIIKSVNSVIPNGTLDQKWWPRQKLNKIIAFGDRYEVNFNENISSKAAWARIITFEEK